VQSYSYIGGIISSVLLHSRITIVNNNTFVYFKITTSFECSHHKEKMVNI
jgi:hypothetical protein